MNYAIQSTQYDDYPLLIFMYSCISNKWASVTVATYKKISATSVSVHDCLTWVIFFNIFTTKSPDGVVSRSVI